MRQPRDIHIELNSTSAQKRVAMTPQERAQRDAAQMGGSAVQLLVPVSVIPAFVTFCFMLHMVYQVAQAPEQIIAGALVSMVFTAMISLLPVTALRMERAYPIAARNANIWWAVLVAVGIIAAAVYFMSARAGGNMSLVLLAMCVVCIPACGILPRWATMALGDVPEPVAASAPSAVAQQPFEAGGHSQEDVFGMWAAGRLMPSQGGRVASTKALADYRETCDLNGVQPMTDAKFYDALKRLAMLSNGAVSSSKVGGIMGYNGWSLPEQQLQAIESAPLERIAGPR